MLATFWHISIFPVVASARCTQTTLRHHRCSLADGSTHVASMRCTSTTLRLNYQQQTCAPSTLHLCDALQLPCDNSSSSACLSAVSLHLCDALQLPCDFDWSDNNRAENRLHLCDALQLPCDDNGLDMKNLSNSVASMRCTSTTLRRTDGGGTKWKNQLHLCDALLLPCDQQSACSCCP